MFSFAFPWLLMLVSIFWFYLFPIYVSSLVKCLFKSFVHLFTECLIFLLLRSECLLHILVKILYQDWRYFLLHCSSLFVILEVFFWKEKEFSLMMSYISILFLEIMVLMLYLRNHCLPKDRKDFLLYFPLEVLYF